MANPSKNSSFPSKSVPSKVCTSASAFQGTSALIRQNPSKSVTCIYVHVFGFAVQAFVHEQMYPYTCVHMESTLRMRMACSVACQALFASVVIHGCCFFDLGLVAFKIASCPQTTILVRFPNPSKNSTFAVTPFVLTPLVRNQTILCLSL